MTICALVLCATTANADVDRTKPRSVTTAPVGGQAAHLAIGLVVDMSGKWHIENGAEQKSLSDGEEVFEGWTLKRDSNDGTIKLALVNKRSVECPGQLHVGDVLSLNRWHHNKDSWWSAFLPIVSQSGGWIWTGARSSSPVVLLDGVMSSKNGSLDFADVMNNLPNGKYVVKVKANGANQPSQKFNVTKQGRSACADQDVDLQPGLYEISVTAPHTTLLPDQLDEALIFIPAAKDYSTFVRLYRKAVKQTAIYGTLSPGSSRAGMLRSYLTALSKNPAAETISQLK
jgi:hypothetical protein